MTKYSIRATAWGMVNIFAVYRAPATLCTRLYAGVVRESSLHMFHAFITSVPTGTDCSDVTVQTSTATDMKVRNCQVIRYKNYHEAQSV